MFLFLAANAHAQAGAETGQGGEMFQIFFLIGLFVLFYVIAIRPQRKRQKEHGQMVSGLNKGDEVVTTSGMLGKITRLEDNFVVLQVGDGIELKFQRSYINAVLPKGTLKNI
jgi:preprotein translocase subunit YajC